jgi:hypothetical protein
MRNFLIGAGIDVGIWTAGGVVFVRLARWSGGWDHGFLAPRKRKVRR